MSMLEGEMQYCENTVKRHQGSTADSMKPPAVAVPKSASNAKDAYDYSPTMEEKLRYGPVNIDEALEKIHTPVMSLRAWKSLKKGVKKFEIPTFETSAEQKEFDAEVQDAEEQGFSVEYVTSGSQTVVIMELMGENFGKAGAKKAMDRTLDGDNIFTFTELILRTQGAVGQLGQLIPNISCYSTNVNYDFRGATPPHPHISVEIDWIEDSKDALDKRFLYFAPTFVAPDGSMVMEVWNLFLARAAPTIPALTVPAHTHMLHFAGVQAILNTATDVGADEPTIIVFHHRHNAYPPSYGVLDWNTSLAAPAGSLFTGRMDANTILRVAYCSKNLLPE